jgi:hypothetical protein
MTNAFRKDLLRPRGKPNYRRLVSGIVPGKKIVSADPRFRGIPNPPQTVTQRGKISKLYTFAAARHDEESMPHRGMV